jgi:hypothetical protein
MLSSGSNGDDTPYDAWEHICADAFDDPKRGIVALLTAYFDAADDPTVKGHPNRPLLHGVSCYLAYKPDWDRFRKAWRKALDSKGMRFFHMTDFEFAQNKIINDKPLPSDKKYDAYRNWAKEEFPAFLKTLHRIINKKTDDGQYKMASFTSAVYKSEFDLKLPAELKDDPECQSYYIFNVANIMKGIAFWCNRHHERYKRNLIHYIFAKGDGEGNNLENWFDHCWNDDGDRYYFRLSKGYSRYPRLTYDMQWMESEPALQAADVATFELSKIAVEVTMRGHANISFDELRKSIPSLCKAPHIGLTLTGSELDAAFAQIIAQRKSRKLDRASGVKYPPS